LAEPTPLRLLKLSEEVIVTDPIPSNRQAMEVTLTTPINVKSESLSHKGCEG